MRLVSAMKAIFIAPSKQQATFWAELWGYKTGEWKYVHIDEVSQILGYYNPDFPAYTCGTDGPRSDMWLQLEMRGFTVYDAQSINVPGNPEITFVG